MQLSIRTIFAPITQSLNHSFHIHTYTHDGIHTIQREEVLDGAEKAFEIRQGRVHFHSFWSTAPGRHEGPGQTVARGRGAVGADCVDVEAADAVLGRVSVGVDRVRRDDCHVRPGGRLEGGQVHAVAGGESGWVVPERDAPREEVLLRPVGAGDERVMCVHVWWKSLR